VNYAIKECFYTLQGEGLHSGRPAVFVRFSGCNLWNGLEKGRDSGTGGCSKWCDTDFRGTDGVRGGCYTAVQLSDLAASCWPAKDSKERMFVVLTGGEPTLQLDESLLAQLHARGFTVAIETNGTRPVPAGVDWICVSPKAGTTLAQSHGHELKLVFPQNGLQPEQFEDLGFEHFLLQPLDGPKKAEHLKQAIDFCMSRPKWRLSVQMHKAIGVP
jgi:7-carboxy-7-deazaguanine synthase